MDILILVNKGLNNLAALPFLESLQKLTRRSLSVRSNLYKYSFRPQTVANWNSLLQSIIDLSTSLGAFQDSLASYYY